MAFDPAFPYKNVDGVNINLTAQEIADIAAAQADYVPPPPPIPDLATQLTNLLITKGTIAKNDINPTTLTAVNATLSAAKLPTIK